MNWLRKKTILKDRLGEKRVVYKFLWLPLCLKNTNGRGEWRWLESSHICQEIKKIDVGGSGEWGNYKYVWRGICW